MVHVSMVFYPVWWIDGKEVLGSIDAHNLAMTVCDHSGVPVSDAVHFQTLFFSSHRSRQEHGTRSETSARWN